MSCQAFAAVLDNSQHSGHELVLLILLADSAHDDGISTMPHMEWLAGRMRLDAEDVQAVIANVADSNELILWTDERAERTYYRVNVPGVDPAPAWFGRTHDARAEWRDLNPRIRREISRRI